MDALSRPVSSLRPKSFLSTGPRDLPTLLKPSTTSHPLRNLSTRPKPPSQSLSHHPLDGPKPLVHPSSSPGLRPHHPPSRPSPRVHRRAATGYAAALVDAARCDGALDAVERDARRLLRAVAGGAAVEDEAVTAAVEGGGFYKLVVVLVRKGKAGMVGEVMAEVGRICDELSGTRLVVVSSEGRMEEAELRRIASKVGRASGAAKVRVTHLFAA